MKKKCQGASKSLGNLKEYIFFSVFASIAKQLEPKAENLCLLRRETLMGDELLKISLVEDIIRKGQD